MAYTNKELAELAMKLREGEVAEINGVRVRAHKLKARNALACTHCKVKCDVVADLAIICALTDERDPHTGQINEYHYMEYANQED